MTALFVAFILTAGVVFWCALAESLVSHTGAADVESLRRRSPLRAQTLERLKTAWPATVAVVRALHVFGTTVGAAVIGAAAAHWLNSVWLGLAGGVVAGVVFVLAALMAHNIGAAHRVGLQILVVPALSLLSRLLSPLVSFGTYWARVAPKARAAETSSEAEIIQLAERSAKAGKLTSSESRMIANALTLDDVRVSELMTPRSVVTALERAMTIAEVFQGFKTIPFARIPVYRDDLDHVVGLVRRRDLLNAKANDRDSEIVGNLAQEIHFVPETVSGAAALQMCLKTHQQLLVVVDEFGSVAGVITMEDIIEHILGKEIFEKDDVAVDMRELARSRQQRGLHPRPTAPARPRGASGS